MQETSHMTRLMNDQDAKELIKKKLYMQAFFFFTFISKKLNIYNRDWKVSKLQLLLKLFPPSKQGSQADCTI